VVLLQEEIEKLHRRNPDTFSVKLKNFKTAWAQQIRGLHKEVKEAKTE